MNKQHTIAMWLGLAASITAVTATSAQEPYSSTTITQLAPGLMSEADYVERLADYLQTFLEGVAVTFSVISAYIVALHFFLRNAPLTVRFFAYCFLTGTLGALGLHIYSAYLLFLALTEGLAELIDTYEVSITAILVYEATQFQSTEVLIWGVWAIGGLCYVSLFLMTFVFDWRTRGQRHASP